MHKQRLTLKSKSIDYKLALWASLLFFTLMSPTIYGGDVYTVEGFISADFGGQPFLAGEVGSGRTRVKSYQYFDEENVIVYSLNFDVQRQYLPESEIPVHLKIEAEADSKLNRSSISNYRTKVIGNQLVAFFTVKYFINGMYWTKVKMVTIVHGRTIRWAVQTADEYSSVQAATIFNQGYQKLRICGLSLYSENIPICDPN